MACYGNEKEGAAAIYSAMGVTSRTHLIKGFADAIQSWLPSASLAAFAMLTPDVRIRRWL